jgi:hypothetical protein
MPMEPCNGYYIPMWWIGIDSARAEGFVGFESIVQLRKTALADVPEKPGVYLILRTPAASPQFIATSTGGHFKGKDPTVDFDTLKNKWVPSSAVVYVGKAGGEGSKATLAVAPKAVPSVWKWGASRSLGRTLHLAASRGRFAGGLLEAHAKRRAAGGRTADD